MQKRESYAQGILFNLCNNPGAIEASGEHLVNTAVEMADLLMKRLFIDPLPDPETVGK